LRPSPARKLNSRSRENEEKSKWSVRASCWTDIVFSRSGLNCGPFRSLVAGLRPSQRAKVQAQGVRHAEGRPRRDPRAQPQVIGEVVFHVAGGEVAVRADDPRRLHLLLRQLGYAGRYVEIFAFGRRLEALDAHEGAEHIEPLRRAVGNDV